VADRGVGDQLFQVGLRHGAQRAVDDVDDAQDRHGHGEIDGDVGEDRERDPHHAVGAHLQEDARQDDRDRGRSLVVGVGKPGMEREELDLDREAEEQAEPQEDPDVEPLDPGVVRGLVQCMDQAEGVLAGGRVRRVKVERQHDDQHQDRAGQGVQEELDGRVFLAGAAPHADEEVHRQEHHFPEHIEEEEVEGDERPHHARLEQKEQRHVPPDLLLDPEGADDREERKQGGQKDHGNRDAVGPHEILDVDVGDPAVLLHELELVRHVHAGQAPVVDVEHADRQQHRDEGCHRRDPLDRAVLPLGDAQDQDPAQERDERHERQDVTIDEPHEGPPPFLILRGT
jgi:hypothetical protein